jgi:hypothetical protein
VPLFRGTSGRARPAVTEVYQEWAGPCKAVRETFKRLFFESGEGALRFLLVRGGTALALPVA